MRELFIKNPTQAGRIQPETLDDEASSPSVPAAASQKCAVRKNPNMFANVLMVQEEKGAPKEPKMMLSLEIRARM